jgi:hypothetical protein
MKQSIKVVEVAAEMETVVLVLEEVMEMRDQC